MTYIMLKYSGGRKGRNFAARTLTLTLRYIDVRHCTEFMLLKIESN
jgi:hypothetical protein